MQPSNPIDVDALAQEIRRVDGNHSLGAGALAEALLPFITAALSVEQARDEEIERLKGERDSWRKDFGTLAKAIVGETGLSAIDEAKRLKSAEPHLASFVGYGLFDEMGKMLAWTDEKGFAQAKWSPSRVRPIYACRPAESSTALRPDRSGSGDAVRVKALDNALRNIKAEAYQREAVPGASASKDAIRGTALALSARLSAIERLCRSALVTSDRTEDGKDEPTIWVSSKQLPPNPEHGYIPCRLQQESNFDTPLYTRKGTALTLASEAGFNDGGEK